MVNILARGVDKQNLAPIDESYQALGLSRNEYLRRFLADGHGSSEKRRLSIDEKAHAMGLSRNEYIRRFLVRHHHVSTRRGLTEADLIAAAEASRDLLDSDVMAGAWR